MEKKEIADQVGEAGDVPLVDPVVDRMIGEKLRTYFDSLLEEKVPGRIVELIVALGERERHDAGEDPK